MLVTHTTRTHSRIQHTTKLLCSIRTKPCAKTSTHPAHSHVHAPGSCARSAQSPWRTSLGGTIPWQTPPGTGSRPGALCYGTCSGAHTQHAHTHTLCPCVGFVRAGRCTSRVLRRLGAAAYPWSSQNLPCMWGLLPPAQACIRSIMLLLGGRSEHCSVCRWAPIKTRPCPAPISGAGRGSFASLNLGLLGSTQPLN